MTLNDEKPPENDTLIVTIHRTENIYNKKKAEEFCKSAY